LRPFLSLKKSVCILPVLILSTVLLPPSPCNPQEDEETYNISLVKTAEPDDSEEIHEIDGKKVLTETYTVKDGDHLWQIFRERELLENRNLAELLSVLKKLNNSLDNIDLIHPGQKIIIPLAISPVKGLSVTAKAGPVETVPLESLDGIDFDEYVVEQGDSVIKIVEDLYEIPQSELYNEYLARLRQLNPGIKDLNIVRPGERIKLPIYSPKVVRQPVKEAKPVSEPMTEEQKEGIRVIAGQLEEIFTSMGEQWLRTGEHFFPLRTGGQLKLNAEPYPIIELKNGRKIIVDLYNDLPERMGNLITSNWDNYRIVHIDGGDDLEKAFYRVTSVCGYKKIYESGEPLVLDGEIPLSINADSIIELEPASGKNRITVINFLDDGEARNPDVIISYLDSLGIMVLDYPAMKERTETTYDKEDIIDSGGDARSLIDTLLDLSGQGYSANRELPVFENGQGDYNLVIKADFLVNISGRDYIIDLSGLGEDIIKLLEERRFKVLSISSGDLPYDIVTKVFDFLGIRYDAGQHKFFSINGPETRNIILNFRGVTFRDDNLKNVFATSLRMSRELILFLNMNGYRVLQLPLAAASAQEQLKG